MKTALTSQTEISFTLLSVLVTWSHCCYDYFCGLQQTHQVRRENYGLSRGRWNFTILRGKEFLGKFLLTVEKGKVQQYRRSGCSIRRRGVYQLWEGMTLNTNNESISTFRRRKLTFIKRRISTNKVIRYRKRRDPY